MGLFKNFKRKRLITSMINLYSKMLLRDKRLLANLIQAKNNYEADLLQDNDINEIIQMIQHYEKDIDTNEIDEIIQYFKKDIALIRFKIKSLKAVKKAYTIFS